MKYNSLRNWIVAFAYVAFIYATINVADIPLRYLRLHSALRIFLVSLYLACFLFLWMRMWRSGVRAWWRYGILIAVFISYGVIGKNVPRLEEQLHFLEYGLTGALFARALESKWTFDWRVFVTAVALASLCGYGDELLQRLSPRRHYSLNDVILNVISAFLGLILYANLKQASPSQDNDQRTLNRSSSIQ